MAKRKSAKSEPQVFTFTDAVAVDIYARLRKKDPALCWKMMQRRANHRAEQLGEPAPDSYQSIERHCKQGNLPRPIIRAGRDYVLEIGYKASLKQSKAGSKSRIGSDEKQIAEAINIFKEMRPKYKSDKTAAMAVCAHLEITISPDTLIKRVKKANG